ncbi:MAG: hypothetical protein JWQ96_67 [Segetibacter sp.]|nr:hypothetical protein [Segetibacter sp.]
MKKDKLNKAGTFLLVLFLASAVKSQTPGLGTWNVANIKGDFNKHWNFFTELQLRSQKFYDDHFYHELKGAIGYKLEKNANLLVGAGQYVTYQYDGSFKSPVRTHEFRVWQQLNLNSEFGKVKIEQRYRAEQRYFKSGYRNRFRTRINATLPIAKTKFYLNAFEEIFLTNTKPFFERNRLYGGVGYKFTDVFSLQLGYTNQYDYNQNINPYTKNFFQASFLFDLNRYTKSRHHSVDE